MSKHIKVRWRGLQARRERWRHLLSLAGEVHATITSARKRWKQMSMDARESLIEREKRRRRHREPNYHCWTHSDCQFRALFRRGYGRAPGPADRLGGPELVADGAPVEPYRPRGAPAGAVT